MLNWELEDSLLDAHPILARPVANTVEALREEAAAVVVVVEEEATDLALAVSNRMLDAVEAALVVAEVEAAPVEVVAMVGVVVDQASVDQIDKTALILAEEDTHAAAHHS